MTKVSRVLQILFWGSVFIYVISLSLYLVQVDLWWQLAEGEHILRTWSLPTAPSVPYGLPAQPYFDEYAGYEVVLALLLKLGGFPALWMVFAGIYVTVLFLPFSASRAKWPAFDFCSTFALVFAAILMRERLEQRPELVGALFLVILMATLRRTQLESVSRGTLLGLFALFVAWTNTHSTFVIGFFVLGLWGLCEIVFKCKTVPVASLARGAATVGATALLASILNPYGPQRLLFPFMQASDPGSTALSPEMWPITDIHSPAGFLSAMTIALLLIGLATTRKVPLWIALFAVVAVFLALKSYRFINVLAIATLFVYAVRADNGARQFWTRPRIVAVALDIVLLFLTLLVLAFDVLSYEEAYGDARANAQLAKRTYRSAPDICAIRVNTTGQREPVLCGQWIGAYLCYADNQFRPLIHSGLSHFSDETKRYFFFMWHEPEALALVTQHLNVNYIIQNKETVAWAPTIHRLPGWRLVACDAAGLLWQRSGDGIQPIAPEMRAKLEASLPVLAEQGEPVSAWAYCTLLEEPERAIDFIERYGGQEWPELTFNHFNAWLDTLPPGVIEAYLARPHPHDYALVDAILNARLGLHHFDVYSESFPPGPRPWYWKTVEVQCALREGDIVRAREVFATIKPSPNATITYYTLWQQIHAHDGAQLGPYEKWQMWNADTKRFMESFSSRLNERVSDLAHQSSN